MNTNYDYAQDVLFNLIASYFVLRVLTNRPLTVYDGRNNRGICIDIHDVARVYAHSICNLEQRSQFCHNVGASTQNICIKQVRMPFVKNLTRHVTQCTSVINILNHRIT